MSRILIIDEDLYSVTGIQTPLNQAGHEVELVMQATAVWPKINSYQPDLIILNATSLTLDGYDIAYRLRHNLGSWHVKIIMLTEHGRRPPLGVADAYISKPINSSQLLTAVNRLLGQWVG